MVKRDIQEEAFHRPIHYESAPWWSFVADKDKHRIVALKESLTNPCHVDRFLSSVLNQMGKEGVSKALDLIEASDYEFINSYRVDNLYEELS